MIHYSLGHMQKEYIQVSEGGTPIFNPLAPKSAIYGTL
jgi:hypothetical protein